jgi:NAD-dependent SIR2 family protein deacetylase
MPAEKPFTEQRIDDALNSQKRFDESWARFQNAFKEMNAALVRNLAGAFGEVINGPPLTDAEKAAIFGGKSATPERFWEKVTAGEVKKIVVCCGAGLSTSAGIPDFRSPMTGIYARLKAERENAAKDGTRSAPETVPEDGAGVKDYTDPSKVPLPESAEECFSFEYFHRNPLPMCQRAASMWPVANPETGKLTSTFKPAPAHAFLRLLADMGVLLRVFTQNIDGLEMDAGLGRDLVINAHGDMRGAHCDECGKQYTGKALRDILPQLKRGEPVECDCAVGKPIETATGRYRTWVRPNIIMFGEALSPEFNTRAREDLAACDAVVVIGTSLNVMPFGGLPGRCGEAVPRLLLNREPAGVFKKPLPYRDVVCLGELNDVCAQAAVHLGKGREYLRLCTELQCKSMPKLPAAKPRVSPPPKARDSPPQARAAAAPAPLRSRSKPVVAAAACRRRSVSKPRAPSRKRAN